MPNPIQTVLLTVMVLSMASVSAKPNTVTLAPLSPEEAARTMIVPDGFKVTLFAGEPDVKQPIAFCIDDRGRLWVAEAYHYGPDGSVFASDWSDTGECHSTRNTQKTTGRIYKISYGTPEVVMPNLSKLSNTELIRLQLHRNDWFVRHARRLLQERFAEGQKMGDMHSKLRAMFIVTDDIPQKLRLLWALHVREHRCIETFKPASRNGGRASPRAITLCGACSVLWTYWLSRTTTLRS